jgi:hypothetical protein
MKHDVMPSVVQMEAEELQQLVKEVKETVATFIQLPKVDVKTEKTFGSLDMWNVRRGFKSAGDIMKRH